MSETQLEVNSLDYLLHHLEGADDLSIKIAAQKRARIVSRFGSPALVEQLNNYLKIMVDQVIEEQRVMAENEEVETATCAECGFSFPVDEMEDHNEGLICQGCLQDIEDNEDEE
jgi:formylmethanofuran dehydrogenase subunit E